MIQNQTKCQDVEEWNAREIRLSNNILSELPDNPNCPILLNLFLNSNQDLMDIPITFFDCMPVLQVLDLSSTSIKCLPSSISKLTTLRQLFMRDCDLLMTLPPEIGALKNLKVFDSEGTQLICLPEQFGLLTKLECLKFSLYNCADRYKQSKQITQIIPAANLSKLVRLKELSICVDSYGEWWEDEVTLIIEILPEVGNLKSLKLYFPTTRLLHKFMETQIWVGVPIYPHLLNFSFIVGHLQQRLISRLPRDLDEMFVKLPKCLKYTNGEGDTAVIAKALKHANALFLDRHWAIKSLSTFGVAVMEKLKYCLLAECSEMLEMVNGSSLYEEEHIENVDSFITPVLGSLQYLAIHYMKSLSCIWKGPIHRGCLLNLKTLAVHSCPELMTILTLGLLYSLTNLEYLIVEDCPKITSLVSLGSDHSTLTRFLPRLKKISLLHLPELVSISSGASIAPSLDSLVIYDCPNLEKPSKMEVADEIKEIKGENEWWDALKWCEQEWTSGQRDYLASVFIPLGTDGDIIDELAAAANTLPHLSDQLSSQQVNCSLCNEMMEPGNLAVLKGEKCPQRIAKCDYCEFRMPAIDLSENQEVCGNRTELCHLCNRYIRLRERTAHEVSCNGVANTTPETSRATREVERGCVPRRRPPPHHFCTRRHLFTIVITGIAVLLGSFLFQSKPDHAQLH